MTAGRSTGTDDGPVMYVGSMDVYLNLWFPDYETAREARARDGGFVGAGMLARRHTKDLTLARELEVAGLCSGGLRLSAEDSNDRLRRLLEGRMDTAVLESSRLVEGGARLRGPSPNLVESARRAAAHYEAAGNGSMREAADRVVLALSPAREAEGATSGGR